MHVVPFQNLPGKSTFRTTFNKAFLCSDRLQTSIEVPCIDLAFEFWLNKGVFNLMISLISVHDLQYCLQSLSLHWFSF